MKKKIVHHPISYVVANVAQKAIYTKHEDSQETR